MNDLTEALAKSRAEFQTIPRNKTVKVATKTGGSYTFAYAPLETILAAVTPALSKHGVAFWQSVEEGNVVTYLAKGEQMLRLAPFPLGLRDGMTMQERGSCVTYASRYSLKLALLLSTEDDDDGNAATNSAPKIVPVKAAQGEPVDDGQLADLATAFEELLAQEPSSAREEDIWRLYKPLDSEMRLALWNHWQDASKLRNTLKRIVEVRRQMEAEQAKVAA